MDKVLQRIIGKALKTPNPRCPKCGVEGVVKGSGEVAWCECPSCHQRISEVTVM